MAHGIPGCYTGNAVKNKYVGLGEKKQRCITNLETFIQSYKNISALWESSSLAEGCSYHQANPTPLTQQLGILAGKAGRITLQTERKGRNSKTSWV